MSKAFSFYYIFKDDIKQDADTAIAHNKRWIELLKEQKVLTSTFSTIW